MPRPLQSNPTNSLLYFRMLAVALLRADVNRGHQQRTIDAEGVHRGDHLVARRRWRSVQVKNPGAARMIALVGHGQKVNLSRNA